MPFYLPTHYLSETVEHQMMFQTPLFQLSFDDIDNRKIEKEIYDLREKDEGCVRSNRGGWHSQTYSDDTFSPIIDAIKKSLPLLPFWPELELKQHGAWANINGPGSYNIAHTHPHVDLSGVYYVKVPEGDCGSITFYDPREVMSYGNVFLNERYIGGDNCPRFPVEGNMYIFPSALKHSVEQNNTSEDRISISFNLWF